MSIERYFPDVSGNEEAINRLNILTISFAESVDDLFAKWESFAIKNGSPQITGDGVLDAFQLNLEKQVRSSSAKRPKHTPRNVLAGGTRFAGLKMETESAMSKNYVVDGLAEPDDIRPSAPSKFKLNTEIQAFQDQRPFNESLREISNALDQQVESMMAVVMQHYNWPRTNFTNPHNTSQNPVTVIGRICREQATAKTLEEAKERWQDSEIGPQSLQIETCRRLGGGLRTPLDVQLIAKDRVEELFEGQIVLLRGKNPKGDGFVVDEIMEIPPLPVAQVGSSQSNAVARILFLNAPGSYANVERVLAWVMASYAQQITRDIPSAIVLCGPLITFDTAEDLVKERNNISDLLKRFRLATAGNVPLLLVPSQNDVLCDPVFPQPGYAGLQLEQPVLALSNPCTFSISEIALTVSTAPTLTDMKVADLAARFKHILRQRQIYPLYPPPLSTNISVPALKLSKLEVAPHVLIMPSEESQHLIVDGVFCLALGDNALGMLSVASGATPLVERLHMDLLRVTESA